MANVFDIILAVLLGLFIIRGALRGLVKEIAGLIGLLLGFFSSARYYHLVTPYVGKYVEDGTATNILGYIVIFMGVSLVVKLFAVAVEKFMTVTSMGWLNHLLGGGVGAVKGILLCAVAITLVAYLFADDQILKASMLAPYIDQIVDWGRKLLPPLGAKTFPV